MANKGRIFWHQGFFGGLELELKEQKEILITEESERSLLYVKLWKNL